MSIRSKILQPSIALICVGLLTVAWISLSSLNANQKVLSRYDEVYFETKVFEAIRADLTALQAFGDEVLAFNQVIAPHRINSEFSTYVERIGHRISDLTSVTSEAADPAEIGRLRRAFSTWTQALEKALGIVPSQFVPSRPHLDSLAQTVQAEVAMMHERALADAAAFGTRSRAGLVSNLTVAAVMMVVLLASVGGFALRRSFWLANAMRSLAVAMERIREGRFDTRPDHAERRDELGEISRGVMAFSQNLLSLTEAKERIEYMALNDALTGLANRTKLTSFLTWLMDPETDQGAVFAVMHLDLDRFKEVNDTQGHAAGDAVLARVGKVLSRNIRKTDLAARVGGDEFVLVLRDTSEQADVEALAERVIEEVSQPFEFSGESLRVGASIGIAFSNTAADPEEVMSNADIALYLAKGAGRGCQRVFTEQTGSEYADRKRLLKDLRLALVNGQVRPFFQPQVDGITNKIVGAEALVRWLHPERGVLSPAQFLDLAHENGLGDLLTEVVINASILALKTWREAGWDVPVVSLNFTARQLRNPDIMEALHLHVEEAGLHPSDIAIEVLETVLFGDENDGAFANLMSMQKHGFRVELDDFGTGHASISTLRKLKVDRVKVDRSFVTGASENPEQEQLLGALIDLCAKLDIECLTEGVETETDKSLLLSLGCRYFQGYAYARPMEVDAFGAWMDQWHETQALQAKAVRS